MGPFACADSREAAATIRKMTDIRVRTSRPFRVEYINLSILRIKEAYNENNQSRRHGGLGLPRLEVTT